MLIKLNEDIFINLHTISIIAKINRKDECRCHFYSDKKKIVAYVDKTKLIAIITSHFPNFVKLGHDYINVNKLIEVNTDTHLKLFFEDADPNISFTYDEDEVSNKEKDAFLSLFNIENISKDDSNLIEDPSDIDDDEDELDEDY